MIKLELPVKPVELTEEIEKELTEEFKKNGTSVWNKSYIKEALLNMSHNKCAYSEQKLNERSTYLEIDHFKHKDKYQDSVVEWGNLLPSCKKSNTTKNDWDVLIDPIVNPLTDNPGDYLYIKGFRFHAKNEKGENTIEAVALNDRIHFVTPRADSAFLIIDKLSDQYKLLQEVDTPRKQNNAINRIKSILEQCGPRHEFSAAISTYLLYEDPLYQKIKSYLISINKWDMQFQEIENELTKIALPS